MILIKNHNSNLLYVYLPCARCCEYNEKKEIVLALKESQSSEGHFNRN